MTLGCIEASIIVKGHMRDIICKLEIVNYELKLIWNSMNKKKNTK